MEGQGPQPSTAWALGAGTCGKHLPRAGGGSRPRLCAQCFLLSSGHVGGALIDTQVSLSGSSLQVCRY